MYLYLKFQVINYERDISKGKKGDTEDLAYKKIAGFNENLTGTVDKPDILHNDEISASGSGSESDEEDDDDEGILFLYSLYPLPPHST